MPVEAVRVLNAARMLAIEALSVVSGAVVNDHLILTKHNGQTMDAGYVKGDPGDFTLAEMWDNPVMTGNPVAPTPTTADNDTSVATTAFVKAALLAAHPVGDIKMCTTNVNPSTYLGGTWIAWGSGRVPVGVGAGQFAGSETTGGAETHLLTAAQSGSPSHTHPASQASHSHTTGADIGYLDVFGNNSSLWGIPLHKAYVGNGQMGGSSATPAVTVSGSTATGAASPHNIVQPYITCYMFKRTA